MYRYMLLGRFIRILGPQYSRLTPKLLGSVLTGVMMSALAVDAAGGGLIALAPDAKNSNLGEVVMLVGLVIQIFTILTYSILFAELVWRYSRDRPVKPFRLRRTRPDQFVAKGSLSKSDMGKLKILTIANTVSMGLIFVRTGYRILLIAGGRDGKSVPDRMIC